MNSDTRPNVLWICTDQQRFDTLGCYGNEFVATDTLDGLAESGMRFEHCFSQSPVCTPSRASFLTGRYPRTTGVRQNGQAIPSGETPISKTLAGSGYRCGLVGKLHLAPAQPAALDDETGTEKRIDDGYEAFHWSHHPTHEVPGNDYLAWLRDQPVAFEDDLYTDESTGALRIDRSWRFDDEPYTDCEHVEVSLPAQFHQTGWCAERAIEFVEAADDRPWLLSVNTFDPHHAFDPPKTYLDRYVEDLEDVPLPNYERGESEDDPPTKRRDHDGAYGTDGYYPYTGMDETDHRLVRAAYWAMVDLIDDQVGRILDALDRTGQADRTLVIFTSDHGELLGDHGVYLKGPYFYDPAIRVPLLISGPGVIDGDETDALVELTDLAPTVAEATGVEPPGLQGRSLWPTLGGDVETHRESVYCEYYNATDNYERPHYGTMVRTDDHKLVRWHSTDAGELYDLSADPHETENRWDDPAYRSQRTELLALLSDRMSETVDPLPERTASW